MIQGGAQTGVGFDVRERKPIDYRHEASSIAERNAPGKLYYEGIPVNVLANDTDEEDQWGWWKLLPFIKCSINNIPISTLEQWGTDNTHWVRLEGSGSGSNSTLYKDQFLQSGNVPATLVGSINSLNKKFTLRATPAFIISCKIDGHIQYEGRHFVVAGKDVTFIEAPLSTTIEGIEVVYASSDGVNVGAGGNVALENGTNTTVSSRLQDGVRIWRVDSLGGGSSVEVVAGTNVTVDPSDGVGDVKRFTVSARDPYFEQAIHFLLSYEFEDKFGEEIKIKEIQFNEGIETASYKVNDEIFVPIILPLTQDIQIPAGADVIWKVNSFNVGKNRGTILIIGDRV